MLANHRIKQTGNNLRIDPTQGTQSAEDFRNRIQLHLHDSVHTIPELDTILSEMSYSIPFPHRVLHKPT